MSVMMTTTMMGRVGSAVVRILEGGTSRRRDALLASALAQVVPPQEERV